MASRKRIDSTRPKANRMSFASVTGLAVASPPGVSAHVQAHVQAPAQRVQRLELFGPASTLDQDP